MDHIENILNNKIIDLTNFAKIDIPDKWKYVKSYFTTHGFCSISFCYTEYIDDVIDTHIKFLKILSQCGDDKSMYELGYMYHYGHNVEKNYKKSFKYYKMASNKGNNIASFSVGYMYEFGLGVEQNCQKAIEYYHYSTRLGNYEAMFNLAIMYLHGFGVEQNYDEFIKYSDMAIEYSNGKYTKEMMDIYENETNRKNRDIIHSECVEQHDISILQKIKKCIRYFGVSHSNEEVVAING
jgi:hypothetical protein